MQAGSCPDGIEVIAVMGEGIIEYTPVPIVRCRNCEWFRDLGEWQACIENAAFAMKTEPDGYCNRGRRAEHGADR